MMICISVKFWNRPILGVPRPEFTAAVFSVHLCLVLKIFGNDGHIHGGVVVG